ncbi:hypothetical protein LWI29_008380 [Acer saccharum]|uniref:Gnk2-homologous domain-containing protein n=1 Tax=Acer saccharum TaxID=4024 RepID=A0AA39VFL8_ACESA|nr:hypothetical protein LWI29_008380 [Acer saccharum]
MAIVVLSAPTTVHRWLWLISFLSFFMSQISLADELNLVGSSCGGTFNNTTDSNLYRSNLARLFSQKLYNEGGNSNYNNSSYGEDPEKVYGLYQCRGDVTNQTCQSCINSTIGDTLNYCNESKSAILWYDECVMRYSDRPFSFTFESRPALRRSNGISINASDLVTVKKALNQSFSKLIAELATSSELKFETVSENLSSSFTLYTLGQCIPDLSTEDCRACLNSAAQLVEYEKRSSRYLYPSCGAGFNLMNSSTDEPITPVQAPTSSGDGELNRRL